MHLFVLALALALPAAAQQYRAFWVDSFRPGFKSPSEVDQLVDDVARARCNTIFMQVRRRADSYYTWTLEVPAQDVTYSPSFDALAYLIERAHARGIQVHAWFNVYTLWPTTIAPPANPEHLWHKHGPRASGDDMWMSVSAAGVPGDSLDPGHPAVTRYLAEVIVDTLDHYDVDGIHLDRIRYAEDAPYGWNPKAIERFQRLYDAPGIPQPNDPAWSDFRRRQVTGLVRQIYLRAIEKKPSVVVSAALISWGNGPGSEAGWRLTDAYGRVFQDWRAWLEEGILDVGIPMHYFRETTHAAFLDRWLDFARPRQYNRRYLPGLAPYLNAIPDTLDQVRRALAASDSGQAAGVSFFSYASTNTMNAANTEFYTRLGDFFGEDAPHPVLEWKDSPTRGHILGWLHVDDGPEWLADGVTAVIASDTGKEIARSALIDGAGFFGFVDLPPDRYQLRLERGGRLLYHATPQDVDAGAITRFEIRLKGEDFQQ